MECKVSIEVTEDDKPDGVVASMTLLRKSSPVALSLDSYTVPVVFDKSDQRQRERQEGKTS